MLTISLSRSVWTLTGALSWGPWGAATPIKTVESNWHFSWHRGMKSLARHHWSVPFSNLNLCTVRLNALQCTSKENAEHKGSTNNNNEETTNPMKRPQIKSKCCFALRKRSCKKNHIWVTSIQPKYPPPANLLGKHCFPNVTGGNGKSCTLADCICEFVWETRT